MLAKETINKHPHIPPADLAEVVIGHPASAAQGDMVASSGQTTEAAQVEKFDSTSCTDMTGTTSNDSNRADQESGGKKKGVSKLNNGMFSSDKVDWNTPANLFALVRQLGPIGLDPCSNAGSIVGAKVEWRLDHGQDGLALPWTGHGLVYVNPPYGAGIIDWVEKGAGEFTNGITGEDELVMLLPARTDTRWFQRWAAQADAICFLRGRLRFLGAPSSAPFPSCVAYWGPRVTRFIKTFAPEGRVVRFEGVAVVGASDDCASEGA